MDPRMTLAGKRVLITGGGSGVGADMARGFAGAGASVVVSGRRLEPLETVAGEIGGRAVAADVTDEASVASMFQAAGPVDIVIANAGASTSAPLAKVGLDDWNAMLAVNLTGVFLTLRAGLRQMSGPGRLIAVASTAGLKGYAYVAPYAAAKHGVVGLIRSVALEVAGRDITANALCPGFLDTEMTDRSVANIVEKTGMSAEDARARLAATNPQKRLIHPAEVTAAAIVAVRPRVGGHQRSGHRHRWGRDVKDTADLSRRRLRLWLRLLRTTRQTENHLREYLRINHQTTLPRFDVMAALYRAGEPMKMSDLSRQLLVSNGNATAVVERLEKDGLARRAPGREDRRVVMVELTDQGRREFGHQAEGHAVEVDATFFEPFGRRSGPVARPVPPHRGDLTCLDPPPMSIPLRGTGCHLRMRSLTSCWNGFDYPDRVNVGFELTDAMVARGHGDRTALIGNGRRRTYKELSDWTNRLAHALVDDLGVKPGNRVLIRSANNPAMVACWLAATKAGAVVVNTMPMLRAGELGQIVDKAEITLALCDTRLMDESGRLRQGQPVPGQGCWF